MGLTVIVGVIEQPDPQKQDPVDQGVVASNQYDFTSTSASDFYAGIKKLIAACQKKARKKAAELHRDPEPCCIDKLVIDGHSCACLGGGEGMDKLTAQQIADLKSWLCPGAVIQDLGCFAFDLKLFKPQYDLHLDLAMLLTENGGTYSGYKSSTVDLYPNVKSTDSDEKKPTDVPIPKGATKADVKKLFKKVDPTGQ